MPRKDLPDVKCTAEQSRTLYVRLLGLGKAHATQLGYTVQGMSQFSALRPWRGLTLLALSYGYLLVWCDRENEECTWYRGEVEARESFWRSFALMRDTAADLAPSAPELPAVD